MLHAAGSTTRVALALFLLAVICSCLPFPCCTRFPKPHSRSRSLGWEGHLGSSEPNPLREREMVDATLPPLPPTSAPTFREVVSFVIVISTIYCACRKPLCPPRSSRLALEQARRTTGAIWRPGLSGWLGWCQACFPLPPARTRLSWRSTALEVSSARSSTSRLGSRTRSWCTG